MPEVKIDFRKLVADLKAEVLAIEKSDAPIKEKTRKFKAAGKKFRHRLYGDKRRYGGARKERRITLNTYNAYLSRARKVFEEMGLRHHLLDRNLEWLGKRYPHHADAIGRLAGLPPTETRLAKKALEDQLRAAIDARHKLTKLDFSRPSAKRTVDQLRKANPAYSNLLEGLLGDDPQAAETALFKVLDEAEPLLEDLHDLKVNHEIMYALQMEKGLRKTHTEKKLQTLGVKKRTAVAIHYPHYIQRVTSLLATPPSPVDSTMAAIAPLTFALCAATGRRPIEVLVQGEFHPIRLSGGKVDPHRLQFSGQAKKRGGDPDQLYTIYTLAPANVVLSAIATLRTLPQVASLPQTEGVDNDTRSLNAKINGRVAPPLNAFAKDFFGDNKRTLKDTRAIYARICYQLWFHRDPRWRSADEDVFFAELLGHDDETTQMHYKQFKVHDCDPEFEPEIKPRKSRLEKLAEFDDLMPDFANGDAAVKLHEKVKRLLREDPNRKITQRLLETEKPTTYRDLAKRYIELCADALGLQKQGNRWKAVEEDEPEVLVEIEVPEAEEAPEPEEAAAQEAAEAKVQPKPRITYNKVNGLWRAAVLVGGEEVSHSLDDDRNTATKEAWIEYLKTTGAEA